MTKLRTLSNGITVALEPMNYLKSVSFGIWIKVGSANETEENNGISHGIEHMLFKGTKQRTAKKLAEDMARIGGTMNAYTSKDYTAFYVTTLDYYLSFAIEMLSDMIRNSLITASDLEKEKEVILEEIDMYNDSLEDLVHEMLQNTVWKGHPLGYLISGTKEVVSSFTRNQLIHFMNQFYTADNMVISIAGRFEEKSVMDYLETCFGTLERGGKPPLVTKPVYYKSRFERQKDVEQVYMNLAFDCINCCSEERYVLPAVNAILGGSENSRLFQVIREELGLAYSIYSYDSLYQTAGLYHIDVVLNPAKVDLVYKTIFEIIEELKRDGITEEELFLIQEQIKAEYMIGNESTRNRMSSNGKSLLTRGTIISEEDTMKALQSVTVQDVHGFFNKYLKQETGSISLVGNLKG